MGETEHQSEPPSNNKRILVLDSEPINHPEQMRFTLERDVKNFAEGTVNLINLCVDKDIDTIFFLDKSARPAAFLFRHIWHEVFLDTPHPNIRFINIGSHDDYSPYKHLTPEVMANLRDKYQGYKDKNLLIADEYISNGATITQAQYAILRTFLEAKNVEYTGIYKDPPRWFYEQTTHAIADPHPDSKAQQKLKEKERDEYVFNPFISEVLNDEQLEKAEVKEHRQELLLLVNEIMKHISLEPLGERHIEPLLSEYRKMRLNEREKEILAEMTAEK